MENEEKITTKTRIKEWIFVLGTLIIVGVASFLAFQYGLNYKDNKTENTETKEEEKELDITSQKYGDGTKTLPEYLVDVYLKSIEIKFLFNDRVYDNDIKMLTVLSNIESEDIDINCSEIYYDKILETDELDSGTNQYLIYNDDDTEYGVAYCYDGEVNYYSYDKLVEKSMELFDENIIQKHKFTDGMNTYDYVDSLDGFIMLTPEGGDVFDIEFTLMSSKIENDKLIIKVSFDEDKTDYTYYNLTFNIVNYNTITFNSFEEIK